MTNELRKGVEVSRHSSQGATQGVVVKKQTSPTQIKKHKVAASPDNPRYLVKSEKSGKQAAHRPEELRKKPCARSVDKDSPKP
ncbi:DUF2945 domain-containing protein [Novosphingobium resinovorum]|uniref:DUF2945 domain-containing protein n=1 Tax=Novosphingobium TaxID=165696 RepID=UPI001B3C6A78|nr:MULTISPECIES: DUF2945 domain-containing protein [Novosphingobium]MBF7013808.1 DUF2945 domain-containing protein [Novosphingobium sp. HR1a]WJM25952.1 DUF2945 domain-containing protein [Novosphingobium resinovorum]